MHSCLSSSSSSFSLKWYWILCLPLLCPRPCVSTSSCHEKLKWNRTCLSRRITKGYRRKFKRQKRANVNGGRQSVEGMSRLHIFLRPEPNDWFADFWQKQHRQTSAIAIAHTLLHRPATVQHFMTLLNSRHRSGFLSALQERKERRINMESSFSGGRNHRVIPAVKRVIYGNYLDVHLHLFHLRN